MLPPLFNASVPLMVVAIPGFNAADNVRLLNAVVPLTVAVALKATVPEPAVNVPLLVKFPDTVRVGVPLKERVAPELMVTLPAAAAALITGLFGVPEGMVTAVEEVGTPPHQLDDVFQSELVEPNHTPLATRLAVTAKRVVLSQPLTV